MLTFPAAFSLLLLASLMIPTGARAAPRPLRIVTINLLHGGMTSELTGRGQHLEERLTMVVRELRTFDADVVGVQEASRGRRRGDVAARLASALGFHHVYAPAAPRWPLVSRVLGLERTGRLEPLPDRDLACPPDRRVRRRLSAGARMRRARHTPGASRGLLDPPRRKRLPCGGGRKYPGRPPTHRPAAPHGRPQRDRALEGNPEPHRRARPRRHLPRGQPRRAGLHGLAARVARASIRVAARGLHPARPRRDPPPPGGRGPGLP